MVDSNISEHEAFMESTKGADFRTVIDLRNKIQNIKTSSVYGGKQEEEQTWFDLFNGTFTFWLSQDLFLIFDLIYYKNK